MKIARACWMPLGLVTLVSVGCSQHGAGASSGQTAAGKAGSAVPVGEVAAGTTAQSAAAGRTESAARPNAAVSGSGGSTKPPASDAAAQAAAGAGGVASASPAAGSSVPAAGSGAPITGCSRELLQATVDAYYTALAAHDPAMLPTTTNVKFTENGMVLELGAGLWQTAGMVKYKHSALDTESCSTVSESVVPDGSTDIPVGLRLELQAQKITEIETIVVRPGDYKVFGSNFPSNTNAIAASKDVVKWEEPVPENQRDTRADIQDWLDKYFRLFPRYGCNLADDCQRLENGGGSFECNAALSCDMAAMPSQRGTLIPRAFVIDSERGIGVGFTMFMGNTDFHMIKKYGGEIHAVHAILGAAESSGWE